MKRVWPVGGAVLLLFSWLSLSSRRSEPARAAPVAASLTAKNCHTVTKKVHGKKQRSRVCKKVGAITPAATLTPTPSAAAAALAEPTPTMESGVIRELRANYCYLPGNSSALPAESLTLQQRIDLVKQNPNAIRVPTGQDTTYRSNSDPTLEYVGTTSGGNNYEENGALFGTSIDSEGYVSLVLMHDDSQCQDFTTAYLLGKPSDPIIFYDGQKNRFVITVQDVVNRLAGLDYHQIQVWLMTKAGIQYYLEPGHAAPDAERVLENVVPYGQNNDKELTFAKAATENAFNAIPQPPGTVNQIPGDVSQEARVHVVALSPLF